MLLSAGVSFLGPSSRASLAISRPGFGRYLVGFVVGATVLLALFDPSPSRGLSFTARLVFWLLHTGLGVALFVVLNRWIVRLGGERWLGNWGAIAAAGLIGAMFLAPAALLVEGLLQVPEDLDSPGEAWLEGRGWLGAVVAEYLQIVLPATALWLALNAPWLLRLDFSGSSPGTRERGKPVSNTGDRTEEPHAELPTSPFLDRIPSAMGQDLVALSSELQYLRVYTKKGKALILHSLREAVDLLEGIDGMQVHRSHWVANQHVRRLAREGRNVRLVMSNGLEIPVSRTFKKTVRETFGDRAD